jgi:Flp pilus assembly pilin Flp
MSELLARSRRFLADEAGASFAEYGLLIVLIALICIAVVRTLGQLILPLFIVDYFK